MRIDDDNLVGLSIEPIWLETTLDTRPLAPARAPSMTRKNVRMGVGVIALVLLVSWLAVGWAKPSANDLLARGWAAYRAGSYRAASVALAEARAAEPEAATIGALERAIAVAPLLDEIEKLIEGGQLARAEAHLATVTERAPRDERAVAIQRSLRVARGAVEPPAVEPAGAKVDAASPGDALTGTERKTTPRMAALTAGAAEPARTAGAQVPRERETVTATVAVAGRVKPQIAKGSIRILSDAPALVLVDGVLMANAAPTTLRLPVGPHAIELRVPGTGRVIAQRAVRVRARHNEVLRLQTRPPATSAGPETLRADLGRGASR